MGRVQGSRQASVTRRWAARLLWEPMGLVCRAGSLTRILRLSSPWVRPSRTCRTTRCGTAASLRCGGGMLKQRIERTWPAQRAVEGARASLCRAQQRSHCRSAPPLTLARRCAAHVPAGACLSPQPPCAPLPPQCATIASIVFGCQRLRRLRPRLAALPLYAQHGTADRACSLDAARCDRVYMYTDVYIRPYVYGRVYVYGRREVRPRGPHSCCACLLEAVPCASSKTWHVS
jgi:hypothetical protein